MIFCPAMVVSYVKNVVSGIDGADQSNICSTWVQFFSQDSHDHGLVHVCFGVCVIPLTHDDTFVFEYVVETTCMTHPAAS
jgi:hypothetical protein